MPPVTFHEFYQFLITEMKERFPNIEYCIAAGGDYVQDIVMEASLSNNKFKFTPYVLFKAGEYNNNYEDIVLQFLEECELQLVLHPQTPQT